MTNNVINFTLEIFRNHILSKTFVQSDFVYRKNLFLYLGKRVTVELIFRPYALHPKTSDFTITPKALPNSIPRKSRILLLS